MRHPPLLALALASTLALAACAASPKLARNVSMVPVGHEPPSAVTEDAPAPRAGWVWAKGYWAWNGHDYEPVRGHWEAVRPGYHYVDAFWENRQGKWLLHAGMWAKN